MKWQGKKMDTLVHDAVITRVVADKKHLRRYGRKKNWNLFFKQAWPPLLVLIIAFLFLVIWCSVRKDFNYNLFDHNKTGFSTILYLWRLYFIEEEKWMLYKKARNCIKNIEIN